MDSQYNLGVMLTKGQGCEKDTEKALIWFERAAKLGMPEAQLAAADAYRIGKDVPVDLEVARVWYEAAAAQGNHAGARIDKNIYVGVVDRGADKIMSAGSGLEFSHRHQLNGLRCLAGKQVGKACTCR